MSLSGLGFFFAQVFRLVHETARTCRLREPYITIYLAVGRCNLMLMLCLAWLCTEKEIDGCVCVCVCVQTVG